MSKELKTSYVRRSQKDYPLSLKLQIVGQIESGELCATSAIRRYGIQSRSTVVRWLRKYGNFDYENQSLNPMAQTPEQRIMELEQKIKLLEKQKNKLEKEAETSDKKAIIFDMMIQLAEEEYNIPIRKNYSPKQSKKSKQIKE